MAGEVFAVTMNYTHIDFSAIEPKLVGYYASSKEWNVAKDSGESDLNYFQKKLYAAMGIPLQYFGIDSNDEHVLGNKLAEMMKIVTLRDFKLYLRAKGYAEFEVELVDHVVIITISNMAPEFVDDLKKEIASKVPLTTAFEIWID